MALLLLVAGRARRAIGTRRLMGGVAGRALAVGRRGCARELVQARQLRRLVAGGAGGRRDGTAGSRAATRTMHAMARRAPAGRVTVLRGCLGRMAARAWRCA